MREYYRVQAEINLDAICNNIKRTREIVKPGTKIMGIVKADGYGHGAVPVAKALSPLVDAFGIAMLEEGVELRRAGIDKPILILGFTPEPLYKELVEQDIMATVFQFEMAEQIGKEAVRQNKKAKIHLKVDTGMSRIGFRDDEKSVDIIKKIQNLDGIIIDGCFTHLSRADEADKTFAHKQIQRYMNFVNKLELAGVKIPTKHVSNSASIMEIPEANLDMVRSGISTYGLYPSDQVDQSRLLLEPAMGITSCISFIKELEAGVEISYGGIFVTKRPTLVATIPVGYGDGYPRSLSSKGRVLIHGQSAPILGRICMDQFMVDVTDIDSVYQGDKVTLLGRDGEEMISVEEWAQLSGSFHYELICDVSKRVPRIYYYQQNKVGTLDFYNCTKETYDLYQL